MFEMLKYGRACCCDERPAVWFVRSYDIAHDGELNSL